MADAISVLGNKGEMAGVAPRADKSTEGVNFGAAAAAAIPQAVGGTEAVELMRGAGVTPRADMSVGLIICGAAAAAAAPQAVGTTDAVEPAGVPPHAAMPAVPRGCGGFAGASWCGEHQLKPVVMSGTGGSVKGRPVLVSFVEPSMEESHFSTTVPRGFFGSAKAAMPRL